MSTDQITFVQKSNTDCLDLHGFVDILDKRKLEPTIEENKFLNKVNWHQKLLNLF